MLLFGFVFTFCELACTLAQPRSSNTVFVMNSAEVGQRLAYLEHCTVRSTIRRVSQCLGQRRVESREPNHNQSRDPQPYANQSQSREPQPYAYQSQCREPQPYAYQSQCREPQPYANQSQCREPQPYAYQSQCREPQPYVEEQRVSHCAELEQCTRSFNEYHYTWYVPQNLSN